MPRVLIVEQRMNFIFMLERGCGLREICRSLHVSLDSIHNIQYAHVLGTKLGRRSRLHVTTRAMERSCV